jgi:hypothetical protein
MTVPHLIEENIYQGTMNFCQFFGLQETPHYYGNFLALRGLHTFTAVPLPLQILNVTQVPTTTTLGFLSLYLYTLWL